MKNKTIPYYVAGALVVAIAVTLFFIFSSLHHKEHFRCSAYAHMDLDLTSTDDIIIDAVFNFQRNKNEALLLINGTVDSPAGKTLLKREVHLALTSDDGNYGYTYALKQISKGPTDSTPDTFFDAVLSEISGDNEDMILNTTKLDAHATLFGGPYSDLFICIPY
jgi:hypothetical protein